MAIEFSNTAQQRVTFSSTVGALPQKSIVIWIDLESFGDTTNQASLLSRSHPSLPISWYTAIYTGSERFVLAVDASGLGGVWATNNNAVTTGNHLLVATYDGTSVANDPAFYIDGVSVAVNELQTPSGTVSTEANHDFILGGFYTTKSHDGKILLPATYNRIITPAEVAGIWNSKGKLPRNGLVFCPYMIGAKGLQAFDGATLAAGNTIVDPCSGAVGVPNGDPIGVAESYLSLK